MYTITDYKQLLSWSKFKFEFLWRDSKTNTWWYLTPIISNGSNAQKECFTLGGRVAYERDLILGYPSLGLALAEHFSFGDNDEIGAILGDGYGAKYLLGKESYRQQGYHSGFNEGKLMCLFDNNPFD
jgi:hypothetical protein